MRPLALPSASQQLSQQLWRYAGAVRWLSRQLWRSFRWRLVRVVAAVQVGVLVVAGSLSLSAHYAQRLESDGQLGFGDFGLAARDESTLALMVATLLLVLLAGGGILFWAQRGIDRMAVELNHRVRTDVALAYGGELPKTADWESQKSVWRALWVLQTRDARRTSIVARKLLRNTVHVGITAAGVAALFYLEPRMTAIFLTIMALALAAYYYANRTSVRATRRYEAVAPTTRRGLHRLLQSFQTLSQPRLSREEFEAALGEEAVAEETDAFKERFGAHVYTEFLSFALMGVVLAALIGYMGREALAGATPWTRLFAYMVALRITLGSVRSVFTTFAFFSRFYPSIDRLTRFFAGSNSTTNREPVEQLPLRGSSAALTESADMAGPVRRGDCLGVVLPVELSRYSLGLLAPLFAGDDPRQRRRLLGQVAMAASLSVPPTAVSMRSLLMLDDGVEAATLRERLGDQAGSVDEALGLDPGAPLPPETWAGLPRHAADRLALVAAEASERPVLAVDRDMATHDWVRRVQRDRPDKIVLLCSGGTPRGDDGLGLSREVVASTDGTVLAVGSPKWIEHNWDAISEGRTPRAASDAFDDEGLDEED